MSTSSAQRAVVLFAHGSRDPLWHRPMEAVAEQLRQDQPGLPVRCAYLELSQPDLPSACDALVQSGATHISVLPMFLGVGRHAREDLPRLLAELQAAHPQVVFEQKAAVGEDLRLIRLLASIAAE